MSNIGWIKGRGAPRVAGPPRVQRLVGPGPGPRPMRVAGPAPRPQRAIVGGETELDELDQDEPPQGTFGMLQGGLQQGRIIHDFAHDPALQNARLRRSMGRGQFFVQEPSHEMYPPGDTGFPWGPESDLWRALKQGDVKLVRDSQGNEFIIPREIYADQDNVPTEDFSSSDFVQMDLIASFGQLKYRYAKSMVAYTITDPPQIGSPILVPAIQSSLLVPPIGGAVVVAQLDLGHRGTPQTVHFDMPPSMIIKAPFAGSFGKLYAKLWPKYYTNQDTGATPIIRHYLTYPGGPILTSELWNSSGTTFMQQNGFANQNQQSVRGWIAEGIQSNDVQSKPIRRFYGTVACTATVQSQQVFCPVAFAATYVQLTANATNATNTTTSFQFYQITTGTSGVPVFQNGPYPPNTLIPIIAGCTQIVVVNAPTAVNITGGTQESPFELDYYLSF